MIASESQQPRNGITRILSNIINTVVGMLGGTNMIKFLLRRLMAAIPVLFAILLVTFILTHLLPGGPFDAVGERRMPDYMVRQLEEKFGLNKPLLINTWNDGYYPDGDDWKIIGYHTETKTIGGNQNEVRQVEEKVLRIDLLDAQFWILAPR
jgi:hypothetical protein